jgi:hypothetical protein
VTATFARGLGTAASVAAGLLALALRRARGARVFRALWNTARRVIYASDLVTPWAPLLTLLNLPFLAATLVSALVVPFAVVAALVALAVAT